MFSIWKESFISTKKHFYHVGGKETNRNAVYEALLSNIEFKNSISNSEMKSRIEFNESQLTTNKEEYKIPTQLSLILEEEQKQLKMHNKL